APSGVGASSKGVVASRPSSTRTVSGPLTAPSGTNARSSVAETTLTVAGASTPGKRTVVSAPKPVPRTVTCWPGYALAGLAALTPNTGKTRNGALDVLDP